MAKTIFDIKDLICPVCHAFFKKAKYLSCHHSYCEGCLEEIFRVNSRIICPECRKETTVPEGGIKNLAINFHLNRIVDDVLAEKLCGECTRKNPATEFCYDCNLYLCHGCKEHHKHSKIFLTHNVESFTNVTANRDKIPSSSSKSNIMTCTIHNDELSFYCETCNKLACKHCILQDHPGHRQDTVKSIAYTNIKGN